MADQKAPKDRRVQVRDMIRRKSDGTKGRVIKIEGGLISVYMVGGGTWNLHETHAPEVLDVWIGDPRTGAYMTLDY